MRRDHLAGTVHIGSARGKIAVWFDETEAWDLYYRLHSDDTFRPELAKAILEAYPDSERNPE